MQLSKNKKPMLLLILLIGFSFCTVKLLEKAQANIKETNIEIEKPQQCENCNSQNSDVLQEKIIENISDDDVVFINKSDTTNVTNLIDSTSVKGINSFDCSNISADTLLASIRKTCSDTGGPVDYKDGKGATSGGGVLVTKDSVIEIAEVNYPLALFLGQSTYQDSNKQIRKDSPEYRSNGQQIDVEYVTKNLSPKESETFSKTLESTEKVPFKVEAEVNVGGADDITSSDAGEYAIRNAPHNPGCKVKGEPCDRKLAISDFNVEKTNNLAADSQYGGYLTMQAPGGDNYEYEEESSCLAKSNFTVWDKGVVNACKEGIGAQIRAVFKQVFSAVKWKRCTVGEEIVNADGSVETVTDTCIDTKNIGIKMTAIFGDPYECTDDLCANAMLVDRYKSVLSPNEAGGLQEGSTNSNKSLTQFVATQCKIRIDGAPFDVYCLWDSSVYLLNYQLQAKDSAPNQEDFPQTFNSYWGSVKKSSDMSSDKYELQ